nr:MULTISPECIES: hypothetical protein [unclassified Mycobacterium]
MIAYLQIWRDILEKAAAAAAALAANMAFTPPGMPFLPPGMPFAPPGLPFAPPGMPFVMPGMPPMPAAPPVAPAPLDYAQQLFSNLQAWRQSLEQLAARPRSPQPSTAPASAGNATGRYPTGDSSGETNPSYPYPIPTPPGADDLSRSGDVERGGGAATSTSKSSRSEVPVAPRNDEQSASVPIDRYGNQSQTWPPPYAPVAPRSPGTSQIPGGADAILNAGPEPPARPIPPIFDDLNQTVPPGFQYDLGGPVAAPTRRPSQIAATTAPAQSPAGSPFLGAIGRVTPDAVQEVVQQSLFKNLGQTPTP